MSHLVVKLSVSRCFGGPEEGGWWFDWTDVLDVHQVGSKSAAKRLIAKLSGPPARHDRFSVLGGSDISFVRVSSLADVKALQSTHRPRYE